MPKHPLSLARRQQKRLDAFRAMDDIRAVTIRKEDILQRAVGEMAPALMLALERCEHRIKLMAVLPEGQERPPCMCDDCSRARTLLRVHATAIENIMAEQDRVIAAYGEKKR